MNSRAIQRGVVVLVLAAVVLPGGNAWGQSLSQRISDYRRRQVARQRTAAQQTREKLASVTRRMNSIISPVRLNGVPAKEAIKWWSKVTNVPVVINWETMVNEGIDVEHPIRLTLAAVPARTVLSLIMQQMAIEMAPMIAEPTPWYVRIMTRNEALGKSVLRVYDLGDLLVEVPNFRNAPRMNLTDALSSGGTSGGGGSGGSGGGGSNIFGDDGGNGDDDDDDSRSQSKLDRGENVAQLIRDSIEPDIWQAHGGAYASIRYFQGRLIVNAPMFVQRQIGGQVGSAAMVRGRTKNLGAASRYPGRANVSKVQPKVAGAASKVSSVQKGK